MDTHVKEHEPVPKNCVGLVYHFCLKSLVPLHWKVVICLSLNLDQNSGVVFRYNLDFLEVEREASIYI